MDNFTILDGVVVTVVSILVVFVVLIGLQIVMNLTRMIVNKQPNQKLEKEQQLSQMNPVLVEDEETRTVAALTALILANQDQQDKQYQITSIKRIR